MVSGRAASPQDAHSLLSKVFQSTDQHLNAFQQLSALFEGIVNQQGEWAHALAAHPVSKLALEALLLHLSREVKDMHELQEPSVNASLH